MFKNLSRLLTAKYLIIIFAISVLIIVSTLNISINSSVNNFFTDLQFELRGPRDLDEDFLLVFIGDEDIQKLGGWPISRDYYSYAIHILKSSGAKVIGLDVLMASADENNPEFDQALVAFLQSTNNVCFPMMFSDFKISDEQSYLAADPIFPVRGLRENAAAIGFSNFEQDLMIRRVPVQVLFNDSVYYSFGSELARLYNKDNLEIISHPDLLLNHFGSIDNVNALSLVELFQTYRQSPDSLKLDNKLVLIAVTAQGVVNLKATPFSDIIPGSLIHLTVAENLLKANFLKVAPVFIQIFILVLLAFIVAMIDRRFNLSRLLIFSAILFLLYIFSTVLAFNFNFTLPVFYPLVVVFFSTGYFYFSRKREEQKQQESLNALLNAQIEEKEKQLQQAQTKEDEILSLQKEISDLKSYSFAELSERKRADTFDNIIYAENSPMQQVLDLVAKVSTDDIPVLIVGATGTGKEMIARTLHQKNKRMTKPFIAVNCGALSETLLDSELFGHEKGSFTGAVTMRRGRFELADGGSIFLDEITETSPAFQAKLLRVLQENSFERLGGERTLKTDIRIIAASNKNIQEEIENNRFRSDLYYRLNGITITIPPLLERRKDIPLLASHFITKYEYDLEISDQAIKLLKNYRWPGNVRELENVIRRAALFAESDKRKLIQVQDLPAEVAETTHSSVADIHKPLEEQILKSLRVLKFSHSAISETAKQLGNRDRGTITEYFRGLCFEYLVQNNMDVEKAASSLSASDDHKVLEQVQVKIEKYLGNINPTQAQNAFKGLPKKYHEYLEQIIKNLS